jgi:dTDP-4-amino-4,6-dideoxygalactose transaminase
LSDVLAAIGVVQLARLPAMNDRRCAIAERYKAAFAAMPELELPPERADRGHCWHLFAVRLRLEQLSIGRGEFIAELQSNGIGCSVHFIPIPCHPYFREKIPPRDPCRRALAEFERLVSLPIYSRMSDQDVDLVIAAVRNVIARNTKQVFAGVSHVL